jgi:2-C-methyl-D-erythritol 4-phosphate cytidylyltransferase
MMISQDSANPKNQVIAVIPAAGSGTRMGSKKAKQFIDLCGKPLLAVTLNRFQECDLVDSIVVAVSGSDVDYCLGEIVYKYKLNKVLKVIAGGKRRQDSVRKGVEAVANSCKWVLIHDGVRPLVSGTLISRVIEAARNSRAVITGLPVKESVKEVNGQGGVLRSVDRSNLWLVQTPQIFRYEDIYQAHQDAIKYDWQEATDDAFLIEKMGVPITMIEGQEENIKITTPKDLKIAQSLISKLR